VWYEVRTSVNNGEPLFWSQPNQDLFKQALFEAREICLFNLSGLSFSGPQVSFYIRPADGFQLPDIMQWIKQTFAVRFNVIDGRTGHIWGDRYWSLILAGEPPEWAEAYVFVPVVCGAGRKAWMHIAAGSVDRRSRNRLRDCASRVSRKQNSTLEYAGAAGNGGCGRKCGAAMDNPAWDAKGRPRPVWRTEKTGFPPDSSRRTAASHG
jgi:hypothetical protein